jgi:DHA1 family bicyclomycin/chloramphenicol resistance-like MFS transporter
MRRFEPGEVLRVASVAQCCCGLLLLFMAAFKPGGLFGILIPLFGYLFFLGLSRPNGMVFIMAPYKDRAGTASALTGALQFLVAALAAMAMGLFHSATALPMAAVMAFFGLAAMTLNLLALRRVRTLPPDVPKEVDLGTKAGIDLLD